MPNSTIPAAATRLPTHRRAFLRQLTAAAALTVPLAAAAMPYTGESDPIFPAIDRHRRLEVAFGDTCRLTDEVAAREEGRTITAADHEIFERAEDAADEALEVLIATTPTTVAGVRAMLTYVFDHRRFGWLDEEREEACITSVLRSPVLAEDARV